MFCLNNPGTHEETIKKSRFIGIAWPCNSDADVVQILRQLHEQYQNASHIAYAFRINTDKRMISRFHDAGEPGGTAGKPIYQHIEGKNLINVLIAVTRYYGGVKLGAGGLTRAYGNCAKKALEASEIVPFVEYTTIRLKIDYKEMQAVEYHLHKFSGKIVQQDFSDHIELLISLPDTNVPSFLKIVSVVHTKT